MRVISGSARSLPLKTVKSDKTRPTTDRIKETLFNMLAPLIPDSRFLDLFSGSGAIGIEALSRGASHAVFCDTQKEAIACIRANLAFTRLADRAEVFELSALETVNRLSVMHAEPFDIIFMDPPYDHGLEEEVLKAVERAGLLKDDGTVIIEASLKSDFSYAGSIGYKIIKEKIYKTNKHVWLGRQ